MYAIGVVTQMKLTPFLKDRLQQRGLFTTSTTVKKFLRLQKKSAIYFSAAYGRVKSRNSYTVLYNNTSLGQIQYFFSIGQHNFAVIHKFGIVALCSTYFSFPFTSLDTVIHPVHVLPLPIADVVDVVDIAEKCIYVPVCDDTKFVVRFCNISIGE